MGFDAPSAFMDIIHSEPDSRPLTLITKLPDNNDANNATADNTEPQVTPMDDNLMN